MTGTILRLQPDRGTGSLRGEDGKTYSFRRSNLSEGWFHELTEGATVTFDEVKGLGASNIRPVRVTDR